MHWVEVWRAISQRQGILGWNSECLLDAGLFNRGPKVLTGRTPGGCWRALERLGGVQRSFLHRKTVYMFRVDLTGELRRNSAQWQLTCVWEKVRNEERRLRNRLRSQKWHWRAWTFHRKNNESHQKMKVKISDGRDPKIWHLGHLKYKILRMLIRQFSVIQETC